MDVKYIPADWEKMRASLGDLIGLGRWGKGMIDDLKDITENLEDTESDIAKYDCDGVISFTHKDRENSYQSLFDDFDVLHEFTGKVGDIVERVIDQPFYEDIDAFVETMRDATISKYTTENRIGATEEQIVYYGYGPAAQQTRKVPKAEVSLDDLLSGDNYYAEELKIQYDRWKAENPDQVFSQEEFRMAAVNMRAFEYESIKDQQYSKEFWVNIGALVVIIGASIICPPAGLALGIAYGGLEVSTAISGKDWISGRELDTGERWFRGLLAPLDIVPGVAGLKKFSTGVRFANQAADLGQIGVKTGVRTSLQQQLKHVGDLVTTAGKQTEIRLRNAGGAIKDATRVVKNKLASDAIDVGRTVDSVITSAKNITSTRNVMAIDDVGRMQMPAENTHFFENRIRDTLRKAEGVNGGGTTRLLDPKASPNAFKNQIGEVLEKYDWDIEKFHEVKLKPIDELSNRELVIMKEIRDSVPKPTPETTLQKTIPATDIEKYLSGDYTEIGGYVAKADDVGHINRYTDVVESSRLDYTSWDGSRPFPEDGNVYGKIKFKTSAVEDIEIPYGERLGGNNSDGPPCTLNGFTGSRNDEIIPEWRFEDRHSPKVGAELYKVENGVEELVGTFDGEKFVSVNSGGN
ncbi:hypothetical protein [Ornithinibacillus xuwenensis]|uniref:Pre-toxin TG domain-containing protein n=1 Tax=Ornithinibacillus xuwenensis TaxID=3144668 RepID=A0ABU9XL24_9BACI